MAEHIQMTPRVQLGVLSLYIEKAIEPFMRKSVILDMCKERGGIVYNQGGPDFAWLPRFRRRRITAGTGYPRLTFPNTPVKRKASLTYREFHLGESVPLMAQLATQNSALNVDNQIQNITEEITGDFMADLPTKFYADGHAAGSMDIHGFESFYANGGALANSPVADPDDSYAGLNTGLGYYNGDWTADSGGSWPTGSGDTSYGAWSPMVVDYNNTLLGGTTANWANQWQAAIRYATMYNELLTSETPDVLLLNPALLMSAKNSLDAGQQVLITDTAKDADVGYKALKFEGLKVVTEYGPMDSVGYFINFDHLSLRCMTSKLVELRTDSDIVTLSDLHALYSVLNMQFESPAWFPKLAAISTAGT